jgi:hypothetical protein
MNKEQIEIPEDIAAFIKKISRGTGGDCYIIAACEKLYRHLKSLPDQTKETGLRELRDRVKELEGYAGMAKDHFPGGFNHAIELVLALIDKTSSPADKPEGENGGIYVYKGELYKHLSAGKMKIGQAWISCIVYQSDKDGSVYVREQMDFHEKFVPAQDF